LKSLENQIAITVRNDAFTLQQNRARVDAAQKARELSAQTLDAEQKKYNLGASTYLAVLQDERDLAAAESGCSEDRPRRYQLSLLGWPRRRQVLITS